jgi:ABC-type uncharacterized transport system permease subunit
MAALLLVAIVGYVVGIFLAGVAMFHGARGARVGASSAFVAAWAVHLGVLVERWLATGRPPLSTGAEYLLVLGWAVASLHLTLWFRRRMNVAGLTLAPLAAAAAAAALPLLGDGGTGGAGRGGPGGLFLVHTSASTLAMATLCVALAMSVVYVVEDRALKSRSALSLVARLPSLDRCDAVGHHALWAGFLLFTVGIATGMAVNGVARGTPWSPQLKQILPLVAWALVAAVLVARLALGFRGRKSAYVTIAAVALGLLTVVGMNL